MHIIEEKKKEACFDMLISSIIARCLACGATVEDGAKGKNIWGSTRGHMRTSCQLHHRVLFFRHKSKRLRIYRLPVGRVQEKQKGEGNFECRQHAM